MTETEVKPATDKQLIFINKLLAERVGNPKIIEMDLDLPNLDVPTASETIRKLLAITPSKRAINIPEGDYTIRGIDGVIRFYTVFFGKKGTTWENILLVNQHISDERIPVKGDTRKSVLSSIAADIKAATLLYGQESGHCARCHKELTNEISRSVGIGPWCQKVMGW